ncbi:MAG: helix-turn-helix domain-containing protein [Rhodospirillales bacterium]|nr:helix-turn-helix domain-containing protein [Rhodospirillales bacterium]
MSLLDTLAEPVDFPTPACKHCEVNREQAFCSGLNRDQLIRLASIRHQLRFEAHASVFDEGDQADNVYALTSGAVKLYKLLSDGRRQIVGFLFPGDIFGLAIDDRYAYSAETLVSTTACRFPHRQLDNVRENIPVIERRVFNLALKDLVRAHEQMLLLGRKSAREKLATFLTSLSRRAVERGHAASPVALPMSRSDIADFLGLTIETVSRTLTQLKKTGIIALPDTGQVTIRNSAALAELAEGGQA